MQTNAVPGTLVNYNTNCLFFAFHYGSSFVCVYSYHFNSVETMDDSIGARLD